MTVIITKSKNLAFGNAEFCLSLIENMKLGGIHIILKKEADEYFAIIDDNLVWHDGMNLLG